jgi:RNA polymerase sigma-70 factor (ECF subfamily)
MSERRSAARAGGSAAPFQAPGSGRRPAGFAELYDAWFDDVYRWLRLLGAPAADQEDLAQEVFLVVRRRLRDFDGRNLAGWLYQISRRQVLRHKRLRWVRRVLRWPSDRALAERLEADVSSKAVVQSPLDALEAKERRALVESLVARMSEKRRVVFALFELDGLTGEEIADMLEVPLNTVWTRLYHARRDFLSSLAEVREQQRAEGGE